MTTEGLLNERERTHGSFADNARASQVLKEVYRRCKGWDRLTPIQREALDNMAIKLSRILSGQSSELDHWLDIQGYAGLAVRELQQ